MNASYYKKSRRKKLGFTFISYTNKCTIAKKGRDDIIIVLEKFVKFENVLPFLPFYKF